MAWPVIFHAVVIAVVIPAMYLANVIKVARIPIMGIRVIKFAVSTVFITAVSEATGNAKMDVKTVSMGHIVTFFVVRIA